MKLSRKINFETKLKINLTQWLINGFNFKEDIPIYYLFCSYYFLYILFISFLFLEIFTPGRSLYLLLDLDASRNIRFYFSRNIRFYRSHISFIHEVLTKVRPCRKKRKMRNYEFFLLSWLC